MTGLLLATLLNLAPGIQLVDNVGARHLALSEARFTPLLVSDDDRVPRPTLDQMSREQLAAELRRLDDERPSLGGPIATLVVGVALIVPGFGITVGGVIGLIANARGAVMGLTTASLILTGIGFAMVTVGIILCIVGGVKLGLRIKDRTLNGREADEIRRRIDAREWGQPQPVPMAPPPLPAQSSLVVPGDLQTVMTF